MMYLANESIISNNPQEGIFLRESPSKNNLRRLEVYLKDLLSESLQGFSDKILKFICSQTFAFKGVFYCIAEKESVLKALSGFGTTLLQLHSPSYNLNEGSLHTEVYHSQKPKIFRNITSHNTFTGLGSFSVSISNIYIIPIVLNQKVLATLELVYFVDVDEMTEDVILESCHLIASPLSSIYNNHLQHDFMLDLKVQHDVITQQKEELLSNLEEIISSKTSLDRQKQQLEITLSELDTGNRRLLQSLNYAKRIQEIILPAQQVLEHTFSEHFVMYYAKDIVSGDFYWFNRTDVSLLGIFDCTGHGVPGAFMTMIGYTLLNEIVNVKRVQDPAQILQLLHEGIRNSLKQDEKENSDGMEAALCKIELMTDFKIKITFAGAKRNIYYIQNGTLQMLKGDRDYLGGGKHRKLKLNFQNQDVILNYGDLIYLFSDGILDACNQYRENFKTSRLEEFINNNFHLNLEQQKKILAKELSDFVRGGEQRDDITVLGIKL
jgi:serine phosphatase RsbU (regulator of sigma subunit)